MKERKYFLALNMIEGLGPLRISLLLKQFGSAEKIFQASEKELLTSPGIGKELAVRIRRFDQRKVEEEIQLCQKHSIQLRSMGEEGYPSILREIPDPPPIIYFRGNLEDWDFNLAIVGSRRASFYGLSLAERFGYQLASLGATIVSGLARGIDSAAHRGALKARGKTIAVLGSGLLQIYPPENRSLAQEIQDSGALISEFPLKTPPLRENFPRRNRIISGLSRGVLVVEAPRRSGALITADLALEQGRDVFAIPGKVDSPTSQGTNYLIKQGAKLVETVEDILEEYGIELGKRTIQQVQLDPKEERLLDLLAQEEMNIDQLLLLSGFSLEELNQHLLSLELKGKVKSNPGGFYSSR